MLTYCILGSNKKLYLQPSLTSLFELSLLLKGILGQNLLHKQHPWCFSVTHQSLEVAQFCPSLREVCFLKKQQNPWEIGLFLRRDPLTFGRPEPEPQHNMKDNVQRLYVVQLEDEYNPASARIYCCEPFESGFQP